LIGRVDMGAARDPDAPVVGHVLGGADLRHGARFQNPIGGPRPVAAMAQAETVRPHWCALKAQYLLAKQARAGKVDGLERAARHQHRLDHGRSGFAPILQGKLVETRHMLSHSYRFDYLRPFVQSTTRSASFSRSSFWPCMWCVAPLRVWLSQRLP